MAKSLLLNVLADVLGNYVEGLTKENLKLGVWSGKLEFSNLKLKDSALDQLNLPIQVKKGSLKRLSVKVPWTSLESKPVEVFIDGLYLLASPLDLSQNTPEEGRQMNLAMRKKKLKGVDDSIMMSVRNLGEMQDPANRATYVQQLATHILDNLEVQISNIHIRYEDSVSEPGKTFGFGITLDKIILTTTDDQWNAKFVKRDAGNKSAAINKLGVISNVGFYWNKSDRSYADLSSSDWEHLMQQLIYKQENQGQPQACERLAFILAPPNQLVLKLTHREMCTETVPSIDLVIESSDIKALFDRQQFRQIMVLQRSFAELDRKRLMCLYRPYKRASEDPRAWWHYAYRLVTGRDLDVANKIKTLVFCVRSRNKYIAFVHKAKVEQYFNEKATTQKPREIEEIEEKLPLPTLLLFHEEGVRAAALEIQKTLAGSTNGNGGGAQKAAPKANAAPSLTKPVAKKSMFSGWFSKKEESPPLPVVTSTTSPKTSLKAVGEESTEDAEDARLMNDLEAQVRRLDEASKAAINQKFSFRGLLQTSATIAVTYDDRPLGTIRAGMTMNIETRYSNVWLEFALRNFSLQDQITPDPFDEMLIVMAADPTNATQSLVKHSKLETDVPFTFILELKPDLIVLKFIALPVIITWNKDCLNYLIHFIVSATEDTKRATINPMLRASLKQFSAEAALPKVDTQIIIEIDAPKIIMPESRGKCPSYTILDTGYLSMNGKLNAQGMDFSISLQQVNITMPDLSGKSATGQYLITPFDFIISIKSVDEVNPVVHVSLELVPRLFADLDAIKLVRIIKLVFVLLESFDMSALKERDEELNAVDSSFTSIADESGEYSSKSRLAAIMRKNAINYDVVATRSTFSLPELVLRLYISEDHVTEVAVRGVFLQVTQRAGDNTIEITVTSLDIRDSQRTPDHPSILVAMPVGEGNQGKLLAVTYRAITSKLSPYFRNFGSEILIFINQIDLFLDEKALLSFKPLFDTIKDGWIERISSVQEQEKVQSFLSKRKSISESDYTKTPSKHGGLERTASVQAIGGMKLEFEWKSVAMHLLQTRYDPSGDPYTVSHYEDSFIFDITNLQMVIQTDEKVVVKALLSNIELTDSRKRSEKLVFRKILRTGKLFESDIISDIASLKLHEHLLNVSFEQDANGNSNIDVTVRNVSGIVAFDVVVDLADLLMNNINALIALIACLSSGEAPIVDKEAAKDAPVKGMVLSISVLNPRLILLENPASEHSKAIEAVCGIFVRYVVVVVDAADNEQRGSFHASLRDLETYAILDITRQKAAHRIIEPLGIEVHLNHSNVKGKLLSMQVAVSCDEIGLRVSLNDIILVQSIFARVGESVSSSKRLVEVDMESTAATSSNQVALQGENLTMYTIRVNLGKLNFILVNDYQGQNNPLIRFDAHHGEFDCSGAIIGLEGEGALSMVAEYYNSSLGCWEPVMEKWKPHVSFKKDLNGVALHLTYMRLIQLNVSGELLKCIVGALNLLERIGGEGSYLQRQKSNPLQFRNSTGIPIIIRDHKSKKVLITLDPFQLDFSKAYGDEKESLASQEALSEEFSLIEEIDVLLGGQFVDSFVPLERLSVRSRKVKVFQLHRLDAEGLLTAPKVTMSTLAPVTEETYQYSRFNPVMSKWEKPWDSMVGDPKEWADVRGKGFRPPKSITLPDGWKWLDADWSVDKNYKIGKEIDGEGWEYATSFANFTHNNQKHAKTTTDCVRRRRWIQRRGIDQTITKQSQETVVATWNLVWELTMNADESKTITLRSIKSIKNDLTVDIEVQLDNGGDNIIEIAASSVYNLPLKQVITAQFRMRPVNSEDYEWSGWIPLENERTTATDKVFSTFCQSSNDRPFYFGHYVLKREGITTTLLRPLMEVYNFLPCPIACGFNEENVSAGTDTITPGGSLQVTSCAIAANIVMAIEIGIYYAVEAFDVPKKDEVSHKIIQLYQNDKTILVSIRMKLNSAGVLSMLVYSSILFVDHSALKLALTIQSSSSQRKSERMKGGSTGGVSSPRSDPGSVSFDSNSWTAVSSGLSLFEPGDHKFAIRSEDGSASLGNLTMESFGASKNNFELFDSNRECFYHVAIKFEPYSVAADLSHVLTIMPSFHVVNCLSETIALKQIDADVDRQTFFAAKSSKSWHSPGTSSEFNMNLRTESCDWTIGYFNINEIGTTTLVVPLHGKTDPNKIGYKAVNIEVRFSEPDEPSYITVVIWESILRRNNRVKKFVFETAVNLSIRNESAIPLLVRQAGINVGRRLHELRRGDSDNEVAKFEALVLPGDWIPYGWSDPDAGCGLEISVPGSSKENYVRPIVVDMLKIGQEVAMDISAFLHHREWIKAKVRTHADGKVLSITGSTSAIERKQSDADSTSESVRDSSNDITLQLSLQTIGISIIADKPTRRELFAIYFEKMRLLLQQVAPSKAQNEAMLIEFKLQDMQIDNFSETAVYPVLFTSLAAQERKDSKMRNKNAKNSNTAIEIEPSANAMETLPFIEFSLFKETPEDQGAGILKSIAFRMLEIKVTLDSASILLYVTDLHSDILEKATNKQVTEKLSLTSNADEFNARVFKFMLSDRLQNIELQYQMSQNRKVFIEQLVIHPMKASLSFYPSRFPRSTKQIHPSLRWMRNLENITSVEDFELRIKSYIATDVMESLPRLMESIGIKITREMRENLVKIAGNLVGSMSLLGKPAGLYKKVGSGVQDFFYEPYNGLMESPRGFVAGVGKGTGKLISGVASGVVGSASNIVGTASGGVATVARGVVRFTGNEDYVKRSEERRREVKASGGGVGAGFKAAGESFVSGFTSGISGLVTKPFEEGRKTGAMGFVKGMGQGIIGVAAKPIMGVTEGISSIAQGIGQSFNPTVGNVHVRSKRAFFRRDPDLLDELVLVPLNQFAAEAQNFVEKRAIRKAYADQFFAAVTLGFQSSAIGEEDAMGLALSRQFLFLLTIQMKIIWSVERSAISHVVLFKQPDGRFGLRFVEYDSAGFLPRQILCHSQRSAAEAYDMFVHFRRYFGNPQQMESSEAVLATMGEGKSSNNLQRTSSSNKMGSEDSSPTGRSPVESSTSSKSNNDGGSNSVKAAAEGQRLVPDYIFGTANSFKFDFERMNNDAIRQRYKEVLAMIRVNLPLQVEDKQRYYRSLDECLWRFVYDYTQNHDYILNPSRCCACLILNHSRSPVQILNTELKEGGNVYVLSVGDGFDGTARMIKPLGGAAVIFAIGNRPTLVNLEHVKIVIDTTAFQAMVSTRVNRSDCTASAGFFASFLEKSRTDWWAKYVISVH